MTRTRLDSALVQRGLIASRRQAEEYIKRGQVTLNKKVVTKIDALVNDGDVIKLAEADRYVGRAALKLDSVAKDLGVNFYNKVVLDVGSSTGGFTDYALQHGAKKVVAVDVGTEQLHKSLKGHPKIELHEKTDIRDFKTDVHFDLILADVSFVSLREILPSIIRLSTPQTMIVAMVKPQFETWADNLKNQGVIKNDRMRRDILKDFELWAKSKLIIVGKADSDVLGTKGNRERFYLLRPMA
jgi:23S rRNA (cytidine1920-2'-O)/16S rRNA (cytidine1409-2'-O)-methyltransferase